MSGVKEFDLKPAVEFVKAVGQKIRNKIAERNARSLLARLEDSIQRFGEQCEPDTRRKTDKRRKEIADNIAQKNFAKILSGEKNSVPETKVETLCDRMMHEAFNKIHITSEWQRTNQSYQKLSIQLTSFFTLDSIERKWSKNDVDALSKEMTTLQSQIEQQSITPMQTLQHLDEIKTRSAKIHQSAASWERRESNIELQIERTLKALNELDYSAEPVRMENDSDILSDRIIEVKIDENKKIILKFSLKDAEDLNASTTLSDAKIHAHLEGLKEWGHIGGCDTIIEPLAEVLSKSGLPSRVNSENGELLYSTIEEDSEEYIGENATDIALESSI